MSTKKLIFLLGGKDLEMQTIKKLLEEYKESNPGKIEFHDKGLTWGADLSEYIELFERYKSDNKGDEKDSNYHIYGVELSDRNALSRGIVNYDVIDHHNSYCDKKTSLEQVVEILKDKFNPHLKLTPYQELVAINDSEYISGMDRKIKEYLANDHFDKIAEIYTELEVTQPTIDDKTPPQEIILSIIEAVRKRDRQAQGVDMEEFKYELVNKNCYTLIETDSIHFSPIADDFYLERYKTITAHEDNDNSLRKLQESLIIHSKTDDSFCIYGPLAHHNQGFIDNSDFYKHKEDYSYYYGGKGVAYFGGVLRIKNKNSWSKLIESIDKFVGNYSSEDYLDMDNTPNPYSKHIFLFPFSYGITSQIKESNKWKRSQLNCGKDINSLADNEKGKESLFNELQYYFPFAHNILYDISSTNNAQPFVRHYERKFYKDAPQATFSFQVTKSCDKKGVLDNITYTLDIAYININLYKTGVGILSIYLNNNRLDQSLPEDILRINQFGRRIMLPFYGEKEPINQPHPEDRFRKETANYFQIKLPPTTFEDDLRDEKIWNASKFIDGIIKELITNYKPYYKLTTAVDQNLYGSLTPIVDDRMFTISYYKSNYAIEQHKKKEYDYWYKFLFVDGRDKTCQCNDMMQSLLQKHTYRRWEDYGSIYGATRYSFVLLATESVPPYILDYFETIYVRMVEIVLCQRSTILLFNHRIKRYNELKNSKQRGKKEKAEKISDIYKDYLEFINLYCLEEITAQEQGIELYEMLRESCNTKYLSEELHKQMSSINDFKNMQESQRLNRGAGSLLVAPILISLVSLYQLAGICDAKPFIWWIIGITAGIGGVICYFIYRWIKNKEK